LWQNKNYPIVAHLDMEIREKVAIKMGKLIGFTAFSFVI
jgi:hypothetical protein